MQLELSDAKTGHVLLVVPVGTGGISPHGARCMAAVQARRFAAGGVWVLLTDGESYHLFVGSRVFAACYDCGRWFLPRDRSREDTCEACRTRGGAPAGSPGRGRRARPARRSRKRAAPDMQLVLPGIER